MDTTLTESQLEEFARLRNRSQALRKLAEKLDYQADDILWRNRVRQIAADDVLWSSEKGEMAKEGLGEGR